MSKITNWDQKFIGLAEHVSSWSKDSSTKVGCIAVGPDNEVRSIGYNGMPRGINDHDLTRHERPKKYLYFEHGERNLIYNAARIGTSLKGCRLYLQWFPCADCARGIIQCGFIEVICKKPDPTTDKRWMEQLTAAEELLIEAGIKITYYEIH